MLYDQKKKRGKDKQCSAKHYIRKLKFHSTRSKLKTLGILEGNAVPAPLVMAIACRVIVE